MTIEPQPPGKTPQPLPFAETPGEPPGGCSRPLLVGCAAAVVLVGLLLLVGLWKAGEIIPALFRWSMDQFEEVVSGNLPPDLGEAERRRLAEAFDAAAAAVEEGSADPAALQALQGRLLEVARSQRLSRDEVLDLIEALEAVPGQRAPPADAQPEPPLEAAPEAA